MTIQSRPLPQHIAQYLNDLGDIRVEELELGTDDIYNILDLDEQSFDWSSISRTVRFNDGKAIRGYNATKAFVTNRLSYVAKIKLRIWKTAFKNNNTGAGLRSTRASPFWYCSKKRCSEMQYFFKLFDGRYCRGIL